MINNDFVFPIQLPFGLLNLVNDLFNPTESGRPGEGGKCPPYSALHKQIPKWITPISIGILNQPYYLDNSPYILLFA